MRGWRNSYGVVGHIVHALVFLTVFPAVFAAMPARAAAGQLIVAFGDSLTAGYGLKPAESFPSQLQARLRSAGVVATVQNAGVSGDTSAAGKARLGWVLNGLKAKPDLVILTLGANDMLRGIQPAQTRANLDAMLADLKRRKIPVIIGGMRAAPNLGRVYQGQFDPIYAAMAKAYSATLYPFFMEGVVGRPSLLLKDGMHPNAQGVAVIVRGIMPLVRRSLG